MFDELERTCDRVALIFNGRIIDIADINELKSSTRKIYKIEFLQKVDYQKFKRLRYKIIRDQKQYNQVTIDIDDKDINRLFKTLKNYQVKFIAEIKFNLEKHFKDVLAEQLKGEK